MAHDRIDYGFAVLRGLLQEGHDNPLPPWQQRQHQQSDDDMLSVLRRIAKPKGP